MRNNENLLLRLFLSFSLLLFSILFIANTTEIKFINHALPVLLISVLAFHINKSWTNPLSIFIIFFYFYNFTSLLIKDLAGDLPLSTLYSRTDLEIIAKQALIAYCVLLAHNIVFVKGTGLKKNDLEQFLLKIESHSSPNRLLIISIGSAFIATATFSQAGLEIIRNGFIDRISVPKFINFNLWLLLGVVSFIGSFFSILIQKKSPRSGFISTCFFGLYFLFDLLIGGRKILIYLALSLMPIFLTDKSKHKKKIHFLLASLIVAVIARSLVDKLFTLSDDYVALLAGVGGEFLFTSMTGYIVSANHASLCAQTGIENYFQWLLYFIPREIFPDKPYSMAYMFAQYMQMDMGFGFTLISESYCIARDYAWLALILSLFFYFGFISISSHYSIFGYFSFAALAMDINRGEISYAITQFLFLFTTFWIYQKIIFVKPTLKKCNCIDAEINTGHRVI